MPNRLLIENRLFHIHIIFSIIGILYWQYFEIIAKNVLFIRKTGKLYFRIQNGLHKRHTEADKKDKKLAVLNYFFVLSFLRAYSIQQK